jgi:hypothetical protein
MNQTEVLERLRSADPVRVHRVAIGTLIQEEVYAEAVRRGLSDHQESERRTERPTRRLGVRAGFALAAVAAVLAIITLAPALTSNAPAYAIRQLPDGTIKIDWSVNSYRPDADAIAAKLRDMGVDVEIVTIPASPSAVGSVTAEFPQGQPSDGIPAGLEITEGTADGLTWTIYPTVFEGPVTLNVDVPAASGERYLSSNSVFMPGEVLAGLQCTLGESPPATDVAARLVKLGIAPIWDVVDPISVSKHYYSEAQVSEVPRGVIFEGYAVDASTVELHVAPPGVSLSDLHADPLSDAPC